MVQLHFIDNQLNHDISKSSNFEKKIMNNDYEVIKTIELSWNHNGYWDVPNYSTATDDARRLVPTTSISDFLQLIDNYSALVFANYGHSSSSAIIQGQLGIYLKDDLYAKIAAFNSSLLSTCFIYSMANLNIFTGTYIIPPTYTITANTSALSWQVGSQATKCALWCDHTNVYSLAINSTAFSASTGQSETHPRLTLIGLK